MTDVTKVCLSEDILGYGQLIVIATAQAREDRLDASTTKSEFFILHLDETGQKLKLVAHDQLDFVASEDAPALNAEDAAARMAGTGEQIIRSMVQKVYIQQDFTPTHRLRVEEKKEGLRALSPFAYSILKNEDKRAVAETFQTVGTASRSPVLKQFLGRLLNASGLKSG